MSFSHQHCRESFAGIHTSTTSGFGLPPSVIIGKVYRVGGDNLFVYCCTSDVYCDRYHRRLRNRLDVCLRHSGTIEVDIVGDKENANTPLESASCRESFRPEGSRRVLRVLYDMSNPFFGLIVSIAIDAICITCARYPLQRAAVGLVGYAAEYAGVENGGCDRRLFSCSNLTHTHCPPRQGEKIKIGTPLKDTIGKVIHGADVTAIPTSKRTCANFNPLDVPEEALMFSLVRLTERSIGRHGSTYRVSCASSACTVGSIKYAKIVGDKYTANLQQHDLWRSPPKCDYLA